MRIPRKIFLAPLILALPLVLVGFARQQHKIIAPSHRLGLEIGLNKPFTVSAAYPGRTLRAFLRMPANADGTAPAFSAIQLAPRVVGDKVQVTVSILSGDTSVVKSCDDWGRLKESKVATYTLTEGQEATVTELPNLGSNYKNGMLTFRAVMGDFGELVESGGCGCAGCQESGLHCCPNAGHCMTCGVCGDVCCSIRPPGGE